MSVGQTFAGIVVRNRACETCIYRRGSNLDIKMLGAQIADPHMNGFFTGHRICHHTEAMCCRGFWNRHRDHFTLGQLAQRLGCVRFEAQDTVTATPAKSSVADTDSSAIPRTQANERAKLPKDRGIL